MATEGQRRRRRRQRARRRARAQGNVTQTPQGQGRQSLPRSAAGRQPRRRRGGSQNPYLQTLLEPSRFPGVKVPDADSFPSSTFFVTDDRTLTTDATGRVAFAVCPGVEGSVLTGVWNVNRFDWTRTDFSSATAIQGVYGRIRPVSAEVIVHFIGTTQNDSGMVCGYLIPNSRVIANSFTHAIAQFTSVTVPLKEGIRVVYKPTDNGDFEYKDSTANGWSPSAAEYFPTPGTGLGIFIEGAATSTAVALVRTHINFEGIATNDTYGMVTMESSPTSVGMFEQALSYVNGISAVSPLAKPVVNSIVAGAVGAGSLFASRMLNRPAIGWNDFV